MTDELIPLDALAQKCGFFQCGESNNGYGCNHPENTELGCCYSFSCPIAYEADIEDLKELDPELAKEYEEMQEEYGEIQTDADWMRVLENS